MNRRRQGGGPVTPPDFTLHSELLRDFFRQKWLCSTWRQKRTIHTVLSFCCFTINCEYTDSNRQQCCTYGGVDFLVAAVNIEKM